MDYTFDNMRRNLICGWGELGDRTADTWLRYNDRFFRGELKPLPVFFVQIARFGHSIGLTCARHLTTHIALCRPQ
jgi:hypothetical protein